MATERSGAVLRQVQTLFGAGTCTGLTDGQLLDRFLAGRDESAFAVLVDRHGPMVLRSAARSSATRTTPKMRSRRRSWSSPAGPH